MEYDPETTVGKQQMAFTSTGFVLFITLCSIIYYLIPKKSRWIVLLAASYVFYAISSWKALLYLIPTTFFSFLFARWMQKIQNAADAELSKQSDKEVKKQIKANAKKKKKSVLTLSLIFCFGILGILKYFNFIAINLSIFLALFNRGFRFSPIDFFIPMGLSFYTFSITGYLFDVYYNKYSAESNIAKYSLFVSWFPSMVQGPINRNNHLREQFFYIEHNFSLQNTQFAIQRILWGFLKKLVIADRASEVVSYIFDNHSQLPCYITLVGLLFYSIQLYADFAGGMDVALGVSELFGIKLVENFRQPYFATSVADFWRRWHITLGNWMKDYIFYPFSLSKTMLNFGKKMSTRSKYLGRVVPMALGNIIVFLLVGIWHGAQWHFVLYGLFHGGIIAFSILMQPIYDRLISLFKINVKSLGWRIFQIIRTFYLINIGCLLDDVTDLSMSWSMTKQLFNPTNFQLISNWSFTTFSKLTIFTVLLFSAVWFFISILKEKNIDIRVSISKLKLPLRWTIYLALILSIPFFQAANMAGFMYAQF